MCFTARPIMSDSLPLDLGLLRVISDDGAIDPAHQAFFTDELLLRLHREMKRVRTIDNRMLTLQRQGRVGFYGTCTGQEAVPIATALGLDDGDWVFPALRESAIMLVRGFPLSSYVAQVFGNSRDVLKGRQMPSHMSSRSVNQVSWGSCIGPQVPQAVGAAWAAKLRGDKMVAVGFLGDGATSQPDFHNAMNFAAVFKIPVLIICQNNQWSISVPVSRQTASETIAVKGRAYGVHAIRVDGNDPLAVLIAVRDAAEYARSGKGPVFLECLTYRMGAHSSSDDPTRYRSNEEVEMWGRRDPILRLERLLLSRGLVDDTRISAIEEEVANELAAAIAEVEPAAAPARETLFEDVYAEMPWHLREQRDELLRTPPAPTSHAGHLALFQTPPQRGSSVTRVGVTERVCTPRPALPRSECVQRHSLQPRDNRHKWSAQLPCRPCHRQRRRWNREAQGYPAGPSRTNTSSRHLHSLPPASSTRRIQRASCRWPSRTALSPRPTPRATRQLHLRSTQ